MIPAPEPLGPLDHAARPCSGGCELCHHPLAETFLQAALAGDQRSALALATEVVARHGMARLHDEVVEVAMVEVGRLWQTDRISIADEHLATAVVEATLAALYPMIDWPVAGPCALIACAAPEHHQLGARMTADRLALDGWRTLFLGGNLPVGALVEKAREIKPALVGLSVALSLHLPAAEATIRAMRSAVPGVRVMVGGRGVRAIHDPRRLGADACVASVARGVHVARPWKR